MDCRVVQLGRQLPTNGISQPAARVPSASCTSTWRRGKCDPPCHLGMSWGLIYFIFELRAWATLLPPDQGHELFHPVHRWIQKASSIHKSTAVPDALMGEQSIGADRCSLVQQLS